MKCIFIKSVKLLTIFAHCQYSDGLGGGVKVGTDPFGDRAGAFVCDSGHKRRRLLRV